MYNNDVIMMFKYFHCSDRLLIYFVIVPPGCKFSYIKKLFPIAKTVYLVASPA